MFAGSAAEVAGEHMSRERDRDRGRSHERKHHSASGEPKTRYYSCERYGNREQGHAHSAGPSRSTSPGEQHETLRLKQVCVCVFLCMSVCVCDCENESMRESISLFRERNEGQRVLYPHIPGICRLPGTRTSVADRMSGMAARR